MFVKKYLPYALCAAYLALTGCTTTTQSNPSRTAIEELLISQAADRAALQLTRKLPQESKVFLDTSNMDGTDVKYAVAALRGALLAKGDVLETDKKNADFIVEARVGALSTDNKTFLVGIPSFSMPVPLSASNLTTPELALYKAQEQNGVAKFAAVTYTKSPN